MNTARETASLWKSGLALAEFLWLMTGKKRRVNPKSGVGIVSRMAQVTYNETRDIHENEHQTINRAGTRRQVAGQTENYPAG
jgi:hypothetical protein